jgi:hypothetical protein
MRSKIKSKLAFVVWYAWYALLQMIYRWPAAAATDTAAGAAAAAQRLQHNNIKYD